MDLICTEAHQHLSEWLGHCSVGNQAVIAGRGREWARADYEVTIPTDGKSILIVPQSHYGMSCMHKAWVRIQLGASKHILHVREVNAVTLGNLYSSQHGPFPPQGPIMQLSYNDKGWAYTRFRCEMRFHTETQGDCHKNCWGCHSLDLPLSIPRLRKKIHRCDCSLHSVLHSKHP